MLFLIGYVGPMAILGLLGLSFVAPVPDNVEARAGVLLFGVVLLVIMDRMGVELDGFGDATQRLAKL